MITLHKRPLPPNCIPRMPDNGQFKTMTNVGGVVLRSFNVLNAPEEMRNDPECCWKLYVDLNSPGPDRGLILPRSYRKRQHISTNYMITRTGEIWELIPPPIRSFHSGASTFNGRDYCTSWMIGVSLIGDAETEYERVQYISLAILINEFRDAYDFDIDNIALHSEVAIPYGRSTEPGSSFDKLFLIESIKYLSIEQERASC